MLVLTIILKQAEGYTIIDLSYCVYRKPIGHNFLKPRGPAGLLLKGGVPKE